MNSARSMFVTAFFLTLACMVIPQTMIADNQDSNANDNEDPTGESEDGMCCLDSGDCTDTTEQICENMNKCQFFPGLRCSSVRGACCTDTDCIDNTTEDCCLSCFGGEFYADEVCGAQKGCCDGVDQCQDNVYELCCIVSGKTPVASCGAPGGVCCEVSGCTDNAYASCCEAEHVNNYAEDGTCADTPHPCGDGDDDDGDTSTSQTGDDPDGSGDENDDCPPGSEPNTCQDCIDCGHDPICNQRETDVTVYCADRQTGNNFGCTEANPTDNRNVTMNVAVDSLETIWEQVSFEFVPHLVAINEPNAPLTGTLTLSELGSSGNPEQIQLSYMYPFIENDPWKDYTLNSPITIDFGIGTCGPSSEAPIVMFSVQSIAGAEMDEPPILLEATLTTEGGQVMGTSTVYINLVTVNLRVDSDNTNHTPPYGPDGDDLEESIEDDINELGRFIPVNDDDQDKDGIPDYGDGFDIAGGGSDGALNDQEDHFVLATLDVHGAEDYDQSRLCFVYDSSDPECASFGGDPGFVSIDPTCQGRLRIWTRNGDTSRNPWPVNELRDGAYGHYVGEWDINDPDNQLSFALTELGFGPDCHQIDLWIEGLIPDIASIEVRADLSGDGIGHDVSDRVNVTGVGIDLDVDSDNDDGSSENFERDDQEDAIEDRENAPNQVDWLGKVVKTNQKDDDRENITLDADTTVDDDDGGDRVPDFADGFGQFSEHAADVQDDSNLYEDDFVPVVVEIPSYIDVAEAKIRLDYSVSNPASVVRVLEFIGSDEMNPTENKTYRYAYYDDFLGRARVWSEPGNVQRDKESIANDGQFIPPGTYTAEQLGFGLDPLTGEWVYARTFYFEAISALSEAGDEKLTVKIDVNGDGQYEHTDQVRFTALSLPVELQVDHRTAYALIPNAIPNPAMIVLNDATIEEPAATFELIDDAVYPTAFRGEDSSWLKWKIREGSPGDVTFDGDDTGTQFSVLGQGVGEVEFYPVLMHQGAEIELTGPTISAEVVSMKYVTIRVNVIYTIDYDTFEILEPGIGEFSDVYDVLEKVNTVWRQAGITVVPEANTDLGDLPSGVVLTDAENGIFRLLVDKNLFDGHMDFGGDMNELNRLNVVNRTPHPSSHIVHVYSIYDYKDESQSGGTMVPIDGNTHTIPVELVINQEIAGVQHLQTNGHPLFVADNDSGEATYSVWAHEIGHYLHLDHPDNSLLLNDHPDKRNLMSANGLYTPDGEIVAVPEDIIRRQAVIARDSIFVKDNGQ